MAHFGDEEAISHYRTLAERLLRALDEHALCGDRYARAFCDDGSAVGVAGNEECEIDLLAQSFAAMTMGRTPETERAMFTAYEKLFDRTHGILRLFTPAFDKTRQKVGYIRSYPPGIRENGGSTPTRRSGVQRPSLPSAAGYRPAAHQCAQSRRTLYGPGGSRRLPRRAVCPLGGYLRCARE